MFLSRNVLIISNGNAKRAYGQGNSNACRNYFKSIASKKLAGYENRQGAGKKTEGTMEEVFGVIFGVKAVVICCLSKQNGKRNQVDTVICTMAFCLSIDTKAGRVMEFGGR